MDLDLVVRTSAILLCASVVAALLRRATPSTRHLVWHLAIVAVVLAPYLMAVVPNVPIPQVQRVQAVQEVQGVHEVQGVQNVQTVRSIELGIENPTLGTVGTLGTAVVGGWFVLCWLLSGVSVWRGSRPAPEAWVNEARLIAKRVGLARDVRVRRLHREASPHVAGLFRSVVMMPPSAEGWTAEARQAALVHELTHISRHDRRTQAVAQMACALYWFNPLVWYASAALARERERACDDEVLRLGARPSAYATLLLDIARGASAWTPAAALSMARPSAIEGRLLSILADAARTPRRSTKWIVGAAIVMLTTTILGAQAARPPAANPAIIESKPRPIVTPAPVMAMDQQVQPTVTAPLIEALDDRDAQVREQAAIGLAFTPGTEVIDPLLRALKDPDSQVREKAAMGLAFRRDPRIVEPLLTAIADRDAQVREKAAIALGASGDDRAVAALTKAARDPDSQVREKAVAGLTLLGLRPSTRLEPAPSAVGGRK
jgi:beta-lactamase regulating signal transducer with metallopeptidase domain